MNMPIYLMSEGALVTTEIDVLILLLFACIAAIARWLYNTKFWTIGQISQRETVERLAESGAISQAVATELEERGV